MKLTKEEKQVLKWIKDLSPIKATTMRGAHTPREVRKIVHSLRAKGCRIGSGCQGYYYIRTKKQLEAYTKVRKSAIFSELKVIAQMEKTTLSELMGQLKLEAK